MVLSSIAFFMVIIQILQRLKRMNLATCFGYKEATFTMVTIGENFDSSLREELLENKRSWAKKHNAPNVLVLRE